MEPAQKRLKLDDLVLSEQEENIAPIRKVNFSFEHNGDSAVDQQTTMLVLSHLSQAGRIDSLELQSHPTKTYGCVQFFKSGPGDQLLNDQEMDCGGVQVYLWKAKDQPTGKLKIVDLNDNCLRKIFSNLSNSDLKRASQVNKKFQLNAHAMFAIRNKSIKFGWLQKFATTEYMENFGHLIKRLEIGGRHETSSHLYVVGIFRKDNIKESTLQLIASYCNLTVLSLADLQRSSMRKITELLLPVFSGLVHLKILRCDLSQSFIEVLRGCSEMTTFEIHNCRGDWEFPAFNIPKLCSFYSLVDDNIHQRTVGVMLTHNAQLKEVVLIHRNLENEIMNTIANNLPLVETITIGRSSGLHELPLEVRDPNVLQHLKNICLGAVHWRRVPYPTSLMKKLAEANIQLESVEILSENVPTTNFLNNFPTLKKLYVVGGPLSMATVSLATLDNLQELRDLVIGKCFASSDAGVLKLISQNKHLHKINFGLDDFEISAALYEQLVHVVQHRPQKIPIQIMLSGKAFRKINYPQTHRDLLSFIDSGFFKYIGSRRAFYNNDF